MHVCRAPLFWTLICHPCSGHVNKCAIRNPHSYVFEHAYASFNDLKMADFDSVLILAILQVNGHVRFNGDCVNDDHIHNHCSASLAPHPCLTVWRYKLADFKRPNDLIYDWDTDELLDPTSYIQWSWETLKAAFLDVMKQCIPKSVLPQKWNLPWLTWKRSYSLSEDETTFMKPTQAMAFGLGPI